MVVRDPYVSTLSAKSALLSRLTIVYYVDYLSGTIHVTTTVQSHNTLISWLCGLGRSSPYFRKTSFSIDSTPIDKPPFKPLPYGRGPSIYIPSVSVVPQITWLSTLRYTSTTTSVLTISSESGISVTPITLSDLK